LLLQYRAPVGTSSRVFNNAPIVAMLRNPEFNDLLPSTLSKLNVNDVREWAHCRSESNTVITSKVTLISIAIAANNCEAVRILIAHGVDVKLLPESPFMLTALEYALFRGYSAIATLLLEHGAPLTGRALGYAAKLGEEVFSSLYDKHCSTPAARMACFTSNAPLPSCHSCKSLDPVQCSISGLE